MPKKKPIKPTKKGLAAAKAKEAKVKAFNKSSTGKRVKTLEDRAKSDSNLADRIEHTALKGHKVLKHVEPLRKSAKEKREKAKKLRQMSSKKKKK